MELAAEDPETGLPEPAIGHAMTGVTDGFAGVGRLWRLADVACGDLLVSSGLDPAELRESFLWLHVRDSYFESASYAADPTTPRSSLAAQMPEPLAAERAQFERRLARALLPRVGARLGIPPAQQSISFGSAADFVRLLAQGPATAGQAGVRRWIVGGVDSLVDAAALSLLAELGLLKNGDSPMGVSPGECAAFLAFESEPGPSRAGVPRLTLEAPVWASDEEHRFTGAPPKGERLAAAIAATLGHIGSRPPPAVAVGDLNGDAYRAAKLGDALFRLRAAGFPSAEHWYPATSFGDTGAAATALSLCVAVRAFARGYAVSPAMLVWAGSDDGTAGSCLVTAQSN